MPQSKNIFFYSRSEEAFVNMSSTIYNQHMSILKETCTEKNVAAATLDLLKTLFARTVPRL